MNRPIHFEIQADDPVRCAKFYTDAFGWLVEEYPSMSYWVCYTGGVKRSYGDPITERGIDGGILKRNRALNPTAGVNASVLTMGTDNYDATASKILAAGGTEAMPKFAILNIAWQGYFLDTEGNIFGLHQPDTNAK